MTKVLSFRVSDEEAQWADEYALSRGVSRQDLLAEGFRVFKDDTLRGVPEIRGRQSSVRDAPDAGVGVCPMREEGLGHIWASARKDPLRSCLFCGAHGREPAPQNHASPAKGEGGGHFAEATLERTELFSGLRPPMQNGTGDPKKAWPNGMPLEMQVAAARIVAEKKARDAAAKK